MTSNNKSYFRLFSCIFICTGAARTLFTDLQRNEIFLIPNGFMSLINRINTLEINGLLLSSTPEEKSRINQILDFFIKNELGFYCNNPDNFPLIENYWEYPGIISNAIIELDANSSYDLPDVINQLQACGCKFLELRFYYHALFRELKDILLLFENSIFRNIDIVAPCDILEGQNPEIIFKMFQRVGHIILYGAEKSDFAEINKKHYITYHTETITSNLHCGVVDPMYFNSTMELYMESQQHNSCLNRKVSIDVEGNIKNCPSLQPVYGNISNSNIQDIVSSHEFQQYWNISKDAIDICKSCEFRYICPDCRAYVENPDDLHSKPLKCGYDPFKGEWENWTAVPWKQNAIDFYKMRDSLPAFGKNF